MLQDINYKKYLSKLFKMNDIDNDNVTLLTITNNETDNNGGFKRLRTVRLGGLNVNDNVNIILGS